MNLRNKLTLANANPNESTPLSRAIFFIIIGVAFYLLDRFSLFIIDDYMYAFKYGTYEPIRTLKDIFESQCDHYMQLNGRFLVHCVVQLFCGMLGVEWFRIFNTIMFVLFSAMTTRLVCETYRASIMWYTLTAFAIWLFIPRIGFTLLGNIACGVNYLWVGVASVAFILLLQKVAESKFSVFANIGLGFVGVLIGSLQESFSIPISGALFLYYCFNFKKFRGSIVWLVCGYWLGAIAMIVAPGNFIRLQKETSSENIIIVSIRRFFAVFGGYWLLILAVVFHIILWCSNRVKIKQFILQNILFYVMLLIGLTFTIIIAYTGEHQLFFVGWLVILLILRIIYTNWNSVNLKKQQVVIAIIFLSMIPMYVYTYKYRAQEYVYRELINKEIKESNCGNVLAGEWYSNVVHNKSGLKNRYTAPVMFEPKKPLTSMYYTGDTEHLKNYIPCPLDELELITNTKSPISPNVWYLEEYYCYVVKVSSTVPIDQVKIEATYPIEGISKLKRKLTKEPLTISYILTEEQVRDVVQYGDSQYAIVWQPYNGKILSLRIAD
ncbi:MAG: hypothetical protein IJ377_05515 [Rikenellaceae bacterium]|nr:hypothetical protein [Rikenellaceae bacterium]